MHALHTQFPDTFEEKETQSAYSLSGDIKLDGLEPYARRLLDAYFSLTLTIKDGDASKQWTLKIIRGKVNAEGESGGETDSWFSETIGRANVDSGALADLLAAIANPISLKPTIKLFLTISLTKSEITDALKNEFRCPLQQVVLFLFTKNFVQNIRDKTLSEFEIGYCRDGKRTTIILFDFPDCLQGDLLTISGPDYQVKDFVCTPLPDEVVTKNRDSLQFRKSYSLGDFRTVWMTPDLFALGDGPMSTSSANIVAQLRTFKALLSVLFLANFVEDESPGAFRVEYRGLGVTRLPGVNRSTLMGQTQDNLDSVYDLYTYAYEDFHADKLEVARQLLSSMAASVESLCVRSTEIKEATEKVYGGVLREKVSEYFATLEKIEERLKTAVGDAATSALGLTRTVSEDLYKIAGVIAGAAIGAILKPDLSTWLGLGASLVIATYLTLVIFYHLATLGRAFGLSMDQHRRYIESFADIVGPDKTQGFLGDVHLQQAKALFENKRRWAERIYGGLLILSLLATYSLAAFGVIESARRAL